MKQFQILIDKLTDNIANGLLYILIVLIVLVFSSVFFRYIFNMSYIIVQEIIMYLHALIFMFGISYALKENSHVKIDVIYNRFNKRTQRVISVA